MPISNIFGGSGGSGSAASNSPLSAVAGASIPPASPVYFSAGKLLPIDVMDGNSSEFIVGFAVAGAGQNAACEYYTNGQLADVAGLTISAMHFYGTAGVTTTPAIANAKYIIRVGRAVSASKLEVDLQAFKI